MALRIKENIDLKELEKYGMLYNPSSECYDDHHNFINLCIYESDRIIQIDINDSALGFSKEYAKSVFKAEHILYDLIKADLVEKVKEKTNDIRNNNSNNNRGNS